ncbi:ABC transporter ATP-binding protein [Cesiribacter andamanensis]|uniref:Lipoprotein-releasing system ATP-binding protein LolD n=1 Tax=Cesiribacter andamanensis AMV16 TaxID=1279009 RepID=M7N3Q9_9BACT|nr:ABC transporter ATP-binding protein [Cesiribacter andamanensis]EMR01846.1 Lipoprotein-releasing system ATP-binding protein LolD [Cesiribacter andamanensis AMV16]
MLIAENIIKSYGDLQVLKGINLHVKQGEIVSIVGASGAGKSTLLHILGTLDTPDGGSLQIKGQPLHRGMNARELSRFRNSNIGFIFQFHNLLPEFTALENAAMPGFIADNRPEEQVRQEATALLQKLGLGQRLHHKPGQMSGGEQQRVAVARALINKPALVFADEPSGNLDSHSADELHHLFFQLREEMGQTFVIVTHNQQLADMADFKYEIEDGVIL